MKLRGKYGVLTVLLLVTLLYFTINTGSAFVIKSNRRAVEAYKNDNLVRLHVIANSNSPRDQLIKRRVRKRIIAVMTDRAGEKKKLSGKGTNELTAIVNNVLQINNAGYSGQVEYGKFYFPRRSYGDLILPPGEYRALRITLGRGQGANWWCVLMPPLCLQNTGRDLDTEEKVEIRLKLVEAVKNMDKNRFSLTQIRKLLNI